MISSRLTKATNSVNDMHDIENWQSRGGLPKRDEKALNNTTAVPTTVADRDLEAGEEGIEMELSKEAESQDEELSDEVATITLDEKPGTETFTVIFSPVPLSSPPFLSARATGRPLRDTEMVELSNFLAKYRTTEPVTELNNKDGAAPFVAVKVPPANMPKESGTPIAFEVRIQHK